MNTVGSLTVNVRDAPGAGASERGCAKLGCAATQAAFSSGAITGSGMADAGRDWPCKRGVTQSCLRRFPWGAPSSTKPALSQATPIFSHGPSCRDVEDWAMAREKPASRMVTAVKIAPNLVLMPDTWSLLHLDTHRLSTLDPFARRSFLPRPAVCSTTGRFAVDGIANLGLDLATRPLLYLADFNSTPNASF